jgi:Uma2 family endonuclease
MMAGSLVGMAVNAVHVTAEQLLRMPDDGQCHELVRGELRVTPPPGFEHGRVALTIGGLLFAHVRNTESGTVLAAETGFLLESDPDTVRAPDAAFISKERVEQVGTTTKYWPGAPDLAVEVVSPDDSFRKVQEKALAWLAAGSVAVLVIDPSERTATVYREQSDAHVYGLDDTLDLGDAVPGFRVGMAELFA